jgi:hypothetical protein
MNRSPRDALSVSDGTPPQRPLNRAAPPMAAHLVPCAGMRRPAGRRSVAVLDHPLNGRRGGGAPAETSSGSWARPGSDKPSSRSGTLSASSRTPAAAVSSDPSSHASVVDDRFPPPPSPYSADATSVRSCQPRCAGRAPTGQRCHEPLPDLGRDTPRPAVGDQHVGSRARRALRLRRSATANPTKRRERLDRLIQVRPETTASNPSPLGTVYGMLDRASRLPALSPRRRAKTPSPACSGRAEDGWGLNVAEAGEEIRSGGT